jgi:Fe2+ or Zn2+ uptake regulation protein
MREMKYPATDPGPLRGLGLRATAPRLAVLAALANVGGHRAADELIAVLRECGYRHARTSVYNALHDLARAGLVREAPVTAGALRYETDTAPHHHFVCRHCGLIINVTVPDEVRAQAYLAIDGIELDGVEIVYRGLCERCRSSGNGALMPR